MRLLLVLQSSWILLATPVLANDAERWIPETCLARPTAEARSESAEARWNAAYSRGWQAIQRRAFFEAESAMCEALVAAREFGPRDWRFAETLDELGLIAFEQRDYDTADLFQGAAIAEMLLAVGPRGEPLRETSASSPVRPDCRSGLRVYTERLGWIHERKPGRADATAIAERPWLVLAAGYIPRDGRLGRRLEWLISQYLLEENLTAAEALAGLRSELLGSGDQR